MTWEVYENDILVNTIIADEDFIYPWASENGYTVVLVPEPEIIDEDSVEYQMQSLKEQVAILQQETNETQTINNEIIQLLAEYYGVEEDDE